jgi:hypothetical protein
MKANSILLIRLRRLKHGLMHIGVEFLGRLAGIKSFQAMFLQRADQDAVGHFDAVVQGGQVGVVRELFGGNGADGAVEVVDGFNEVARETLDREVFGALDLALCALLEVAEVGDGAEVFVLGHIISI